MVAKHTETTLGHITGKQAIFYPHQQECQDLYLWRDDSLQFNCAFNKLAYVYILVTKYYLKKSM